ncbi:MAG: HAD family hydrolase [Lachnospiraceae bacterium]|nr:HAD family hydrolase [Lachnospiraceae bacterium]
MLKKAILFDLDGTLLPMNTNEFVRAYFGLLGKQMIAHGYDPEKFKKGMWGGVEASIRNDGSMLNEERFWSVMNHVMEKDCREDAEIFEEFYRNEYHQAKTVCGFNPLAAEAVKLAREKAEKVILATSPLYPAIAIEGRLSWAGLKMEDFDLVTTYDTERFCKPNPAYYADIIARFGYEPAECVMIGNDEKEDMWGAEKAGIQGYLVTDDLIPSEDHPHTGLRGTFAELLEWLKQMSAE